MVGPQTNTTLVGRLRIRSRSSDPQAEQQRIARMLRSATLHPAGLPESATLVVRRLVDPLPSRLRVGPLDILPDASWQRAVSAALERLAVSAARPAYGAVPAEIEAVLFYDRAEVLASLALDWMSGTLPVQWWWRELLRGSDVITALLREWIESPHYVPAAVDLLAKRRHAIQFVQRLPQQAAAAIVESVLNVHCIPCPRIDAMTQQKIPEDHDEPPAWSPDAVQTQTRRYTAPLLAPSLPWVPEASTPGLLPVQRMLLVQSLMLRRAPAIARTVAFQKKLLLWQARAESTGLIESHAEQVAQDIKSGASLPTISTFEMPEQVAAPGTANGFQPVSSTNELLEEAGPQLTSVRTAQTGREAIPESLLPEVESGEQAAMLAKDDLIAATELSQQPAIAEQEVISISETASAPVARLDAAQTEQKTGPSQTLETAYGGVFFLLGLALYLYIYGDFTSPSEPGLELNICDFLALMANELTGGEIKKDPLWDELSSLAGRSKSTKPGLGFDPPNEWRLPPEWLEPFSQDYDPQPVLTNGRMIAMHPAGFTVIDVPAETNAQCGIGEGAESVDRLQRWVGWMASYFRARLVRALGREDAVFLLCTRPARVVFTLTHIDVTFSLDHHPIELRMAGLDRDLGWIPAAGRYLSFHFA
ncbi:MAG: hypothetical protein LAO78_13090 [Acidobacteriia bacterium]|nr:hypothetical protein [Terriglobia bacterium]